MVEIPGVSQAEKGVGRRSFLVIPATIVLARIHVTSCSHRVRTKNIKKKKKKKTEKKTWKG